MAPILKMPNWTGSMVIYNTSGWGLGYMLM